MFVTKCTKMKKISNLIFIVKPQNVLGIPWRLKFLITVSAFELILYDVFLSHHGLSEKIRHDIGVQR